MAGHHNDTELWRALQAQGFWGSLRVVSEWATRRRHAEKVDAETLHRIPSARTIARLLTIGRDDLSKAETVTVAAVEAGVPSMIEARELVDHFHVMIRRKIEADLDSWIDRARTMREVAIFGSHRIRKKPINRSIRRVQIAQPLVISVGYIDRGRRDDDGALPPVRGRPSRKP